MGWFLPFIAFATINIYFCIFDLLPMYKVLMWIKYKCDKEQAFTIVYLWNHNTNITCTNVVILLLTNNSLLFIHLWTSVLYIILSICTIKASFG